MRLLRRLRAGLPTATLMDKSVVEYGQPEHSVVTTCAYCGVGCSFKAEMRGDQVIRMVPWKDGRANHGHSCVKGRFAWGYANHPDRILSPMVREKITDPWRKVTWTRRLPASPRSSSASSEGRQGRRRRDYLLALHRRGSLSGAEADPHRIRQQQHRHCARVCHSPTGYGLGQTFGTSAGTQDFDSIEDTDVMIVIGANPTDGIRCSARV